MRILIAGFQHETNTFALSRAGYENFVRGEGLPALCRGEALLALRGINIPAGGFIRAMQEQHELLPVIWAGASPSGHVRQEAFDRITGEIVDAARSRDLDAIYLDLHGAMVTEACDDGEGELLQRLRAVVGPAMPVVVSLDLHANVTERMLKLATALVAYRTYPHVDMAETGERTARLLQRIFAGETFARASRRIPFLIPVNAGCTMLEPARALYDRLSANGEQSILSFAAGFPAADFPECGPTVWGYGADQALIDRMVTEFAEAVAAREADFNVRFYTPEGAVREAMRIAAGATRPVVIADTQDNPGAGGESNTTGMLRALLGCGARDAAIGLICDRAAAEMAHRAGLDATIELSLGGTSRTPGDAPFAGRFRVTHLSDGNCRYDGPMMTGHTAALGPVAGLTIDGVRIVVSSSRTSMIDRNLFRLGGVEPERMKILVNKSSVHFRADFEPIAERVLIAKAPGPFLADPAEIPWSRLATGMRVAPHGRTFAALAEGGE